MDDTRNSHKAACRLGLQKVFVAGPFFKAIDSATGRLPPRDQQRINGLISHFESQGCIVFNAHKREKWGEECLLPEVFTRLDFDEISQSDVLVAMPGAPASPGTHVELGWASAMGKPIVMLLEKGCEYAGLVVGLGTVASVETVEMVEGVVPMPALDEALDRAVTKSRSRNRRSPSSAA